MSLKKIAFAVIIFHGGLIAWGVHQTSRLDPTQKPKRKLLAQTVTLREPASPGRAKEEPKVKKAFPEESRSNSQHSAVVKAVENKPKKEVKQKSANTFSKEERPKEEKRKVSKEMIAKVQENIAKIHKTSDKVCQNERVDVPQAFKSSGAEGRKKEDALSSQESGYRDELANRLKLLLRLPEYGKVNIKLTLNRLGKVRKVMIEYSESESNKHYVETNVPQLAFPPFGNNFSGIGQCTFLISLNNED